MVLIACLAPGFAVLPAPAAVFLAAWIVAVYSLVAVFGTITFVESLVIFAIGAVLLALTLPAVQSKCRSRRTPLAGPAAPVIPTFQGSPASSPPQSELPR